MEELSGELDREQQGEMNECNHGHNLYCLNREVAYALSLHKLQVLPGN